MVIFLQGTLRSTGERVRVIWDRGEIRPDAGGIVPLFRLRALELDGQIVGPLPGGWTRKASEHLQDPRSFMALAHDVLDNLEVLNQREVDGEMQRLYPDDDEPEGAVY